MAAFGAESRSAVIPSLADARELASDHNLIPLRVTYVDDCETPVSAFLKLRGQGNAFLLESADRAKQFGRFSFLGFRPRAELRLSGGRLTETLRSGAEREIDFTDPYEAVSSYLAKYRPARLDGLPPFAGGAVGVFGYDLVRFVEPLGEANPDPVGIPDLALMISDVLVAFDHLKHETTIIANAVFDSPDELDVAYMRAEDEIIHVRELLRGPVPHPDPPASERKSPDLESNMTRERFEATVARIIDYIYAGDAFQVVPSQRWSAPVPVEAFSIYRGLRTVNPSPYMYFLDFGDFAIAGASPEPLVKVFRGEAQMRPIAGTYPRGKNVEEDRRAAARMLADEKERAEHIMLVDLTRNDLGRVSRYGSVKVDELMVVETYSHVLHIVSNVSGQLTEGVGPMDVLRSVLPAGTLSGAPKVRAMQIIDELEPVKRGPYGGAVGYLSYGGDLDTCIHIRTVVVKDGVAHIQTGGGTVADAKPANEYRESQNKARAMVEAIDLAVGQPDWR